MQNLQHRFDWHCIAQIYSGDFAKFCGLFRIYELSHTTLVLYGIHKVSYVTIVWSAVKLDYSKASKHMASTWAYLADTRFLIGSRDKGYIET